MTDKHILIVDISFIAIQQIANQTAAAWVFLENVQNDKWLETICKWSSAQAALDHLNTSGVWVNPCVCPCDATRRVQTASLTPFALIWMFTLLHTWHFTRFVYGLWRLLGASACINDSGGSEDTVWMQGVLQSWTKRHILLFMDLCGEACGRLMCERTLFLKLLRWASFYQREE